MTSVSRLKKPFGASGGKKTKADGDSMSDTLLSPSKASVGRSSLRSRSPSIFRSYSAASGLSDGSAAEAALAVEDVEPIKLSPSEVTMELTERLPLRLESTEMPWGDRVYALQRLTSIVLGGAASHKDFLSSFIALKHALCAQIMDRRSAVVKEVSRALAAVAEAVGPAFEPYADPFVLALMRQNVVTIQVIAESTANCIRLILLHSGAGRALVHRLRDAVKENAHPTTRIRAVEYLQLLLERELERRDDASHSFKSSFEKAACKAASDSVAEVRRGGRRLLVLLAELHPQLVSKFENNLDSATLRAFKEDQVHWHSTADEHRFDFVLPGGASLRECFQFRLVKGAHDGLRRRRAGSAERAGPSSTSSSPTPHNMRKGSSSLATKRKTPQSARGKGKKTPGRTERAPEAAPAPSPAALNGIDESAIEDSILSDNPFSSRGGGIEPGDSFSLDGSLGDAHDIVHEALDGDHEVNGDWESTSSEESAAGFAISEVEANGHGAPQPSTAAAPPHDRVESDPHAASERGNRAASGGEHARRSTKPPSGAVSGSSAHTDASSSSAAAAERERLEQRNARLERELEVLRARQHAAGSSSGDAAVRDVTGQYNDNKDVTEVRGGGTDAGTVAAAAAAPAHTSTSTGALRVDTNAVAADASSVTAVRTPSSPASTYNPLAGDLARAGLGPQVVVERHSGPTGSAPAPAPAVLSLGTGSSMERDAVVESARAFAKVKELESRIRALEEQLATKTAEASSVTGEKADLVSTLQSGGGVACTLAELALHACGEAESRGSSVSEARSSLAAAETAETVQVAFEHALQLLSEGVQDLATALETRDRREEVETLRQSLNEQREAQEALQREFDDLKGLYIREAEESKRAAELVDAERAAHEETRAAQRSLEERVAVVEGDLEGARAEIEVLRNSRAELRDQVNAAEQRAAEAERTAAAATKRAARASTHRGHAGGPLATVTSQSSPGVRDRAAKPVDAPSPSRALVASTPTRTRMAELESRYERSRLREELSRVRAAMAHEVVRRTGNEATDAATSSAGASHSEPLIEHAEEPHRAVDSATSAAAAPTSELERLRREVARLELQEQQQHHHHRGDSASDPATLQREVVETQSRLNERAAAKGMVDTLRDSLHNELSALKGKLSKYHGATASIKMMDQSVRMRQQVSASSNGSAGPSAPNDPASTARHDAPHHRTETQEIDNVRDLELSAAELQLDWAIEAKRVDKSPEAVRRDAQAEIARLDRQIRELEESRNSADALRRKIVSELDDLEIKLEAKKAVVRSVESSVHAALSGDSTPKDAVNLRRLETRLETEMSDFAALGERRDRLSSDVRVAERAVDEANTELKDLRAAKKRLEKSATKPEAKEKRVTLSRGRMVARRGGTSADPVQTAVYVT